MTIADALVDRAFSVCLLEAGGERFDRRSQDLLRGEVVGLPYERLDRSRLRHLGGSTGRLGWGGWCKPLDAEDFAARHWVAGSGWPFRRSHLMPHYRRAARLLRVPLRQAQRSLPVEGLRTTSEPCFLSPGLRLADTVRPRLERARNVTVLLNAAAIRIHADGAGRTAVAIDARAPGDRTTRVRARLFVLAAGGIENARLLLASNDVVRAGLGNAHDLVGRYFADHPRFHFGEMELAPGTCDWRALDPGWAHRQRARAGGAGIGAFALRLPAAVQAREGLLNARVWVLPAGRDHESSGLWRLGQAVRWGGLPHQPLRTLARSARHIAAGPQRLAARLAGTPLCRLVTIIEPEPDPSSRITLSPGRDALGLPVVRLDWRLTDLAFRTVRRTLEILREDLADMGLASVRLPRTEVCPEPLWVWHHMGTTRMHEDPRRGVVDADCRIHGMHNLYVAGSSVFPTFGNDMPTLTIIALAYRLAEHLEARLATLDAGLPVAATGPSGPPPPPPGASLDGLWHTQQ